LLDNGFEELPLVMKALREVVATIDSDYAKDHDEFFVGFEGSFGAKHVTPRSLTSRYLGNMVCVEGIATKSKMRYE
jgi:DNA replication licensing factor MCM3